MSEAAAGAAPGADSGFGLDNLPYGVFSPRSEPPRVGVRVGDAVLDLARVAEGGLLDGALEDPVGAFASPSLNAFMARGRPVWGSVRRRLQELLGDDGAPLEAARATAFHDIGEVDLALPIEVGDYVDFYSSREHASNLGRLFRPGGEPLLPNWHHLPVGYHGRSSTFVVSGTPIARPRGQRRGAEGGAPTFGPSDRLDIELEVGFINAKPSRMGEPVDTAAARDHVFGVVLLNDWSARDIQAWEYQPLGPFLGKSFATSISPWVVTLEALEPFRVAGPIQEPPVLEYLRCKEDWAFDVSLEAALRSEEMSEAGRPPDVVASTNLRGVYWNPAQHIAHATVNGARLRTGDIHGSGTVSGSEPGTVGSLVELSQGGTEPFTLSDRSRRTFLADGDSVVLRGWAGGGARPLVSLGEVEGTILPSPRLP